MLVKLYSFSNEAINSIDTIDAIEVNKDVIISIDGGSTNTGISIFSIQGKEALYSLRVYNNNIGDDKLLRFKLEFKDLVLGLITKLGDNLKGIYYEEPYLGYASAVKPLYLLESTIPELKLEHKDLKCLVYHTINNKVWKRNLFMLFKDILVDDKYLDDKAKIRKCLLRHYINYKGMDKLQQDIYDSLGLGLVVVNCLESNTMDLILPKRKVSNYKYKATDVTDIVANRLNGEVDIDKLLLYIKSNYKSLGINKKVADYGKIKHLDTDKRGKRYLDVDLRVRESMLDNSMCIYFSENVDSNILLKYNLKRVKDTYGYICLLFHRCSYKNIN